MLLLTQTAVSVIRRLLDHPDMPIEGGLRIAGPGNGAEALTASAAKEPFEGDHVIEQDGARLFVEPGAVTALDNKILDANLADDGTAVRFRLSTQ